MKKKVFISILLVVTASQIWAQFLVPLSPTPIIDGIIDSNDPWSDTWIPQDSILGYSTMNSHFQMVHDKKNIYIVVKVNDITPNNDTIEIPNSYERDCIETFFSMKTNDFIIGDWGEGDWQIRCQRYSESNNYIDGSSGTIDLLLNNNLQYAAAGDSNTYLIELAFNIQALAGESNFNGFSFRFDIATSDNDGTGRVKQCWWLNVLDYSGPIPANWDHIELEGMETSVKNTKSENSLIVFPNPTNTTLNLSLPKNVETINIINIQGQIVYSLRKGQISQSPLTINVSHLPKGVYFIKANSYVERIIVK